MGRLLTGRLFQHTAARRRLVFGVEQPIQTAGFNTQPPEGGWIINYLMMIYF